MKRSGWLSRGRRIKRSRWRPKRKRADEPRVKGRHSLSVPAWKARKAELRVRSGGRCEVELWELRDSENAQWRCERRAVDPHHVLPTSLGGSDDLSNLLHACRDCHRWFDEPHTGPRGRLVAHRVPYDWAPRCGYLCAPVMVDKWTARAMGLA